MKTIDYVALTFAGESLDPVEVTALLGVTPTKAFTKGDTNVHPEPTHRGYWRFRIDAAGGELNSYLESLLEAIRGRETEVAALARRYEATITIVADLTDQIEGEVVISPTVLAALAQFGAALRFYWLYADGTDLESM
jgi:hypothetical protein